MNDSIAIGERIIACLSYITMGFAGFIWLIAMFLTGRQLGGFLKYHIFQSIFISITYYLLSVICGFLLNILSFIPFINRLVAQITFLFNTPLFGQYSLIQAIIYTIILYLAVTSLMGIFSRIPFISEIIDHNVH